MTHIPTPCPLASGGDTSPVSRPSASHDLSGRASGISSRESPSCAQNRPNRPNGPFPTEIRRVFSVPFGQRPSIARRNRPWKTSKLLRLEGSAGGGPRLVRPAVGRIQGAFLPRAIPARTRRNEARLRSSLGLCHARRQAGRARAGDPRRAGPQIGAGPPTQATSARSEPTRRMIAVGRCPGHPPAPRWMTAWAERAPWRHDPSADAGTKFEGGRHEAALTFSSGLV